MSTESNKDHQDIEWLVLHAVAKALRKGTAVIEGGRRLYPLNKHEQSQLRKVGAESYIVAGHNLIFDIDVLAEELSAMELFWSVMTIKDRVALLKQHDLSGRLGSRDWSALTEPERTQISAILPSEPEATDEPQTDLVMWVGTRYYPTIADFISEARGQGVAKRIGRVLTELELGKTRVFLVHDEGVSGEAAIFGYFTLERVEAIETLPEHGYDYCTLVSIREAAAESPRLCGYRDTKGALYLVGTHLTVFKRCRAYEAFVDTKRFRGALRIENGLDIILCKDKRKFRILPSQDRKQAAKRTQHSKRWRSKDDERLLEMLRTSNGSRASVFARFSQETGHSRAKVAYRWTKLKDKGA